MQVKGGRLELLVPHMLRGQLLRPGFVRLSLRLGLTRQMPAWAKLQFTNNGITPADLDFVLGRITSLESWVDEWESLGRAHEQAGHDALVLGKPAEASRRFLWASAAYNFAQYVVFMNPERKKRLHEMCVAAYALAGLGGLAQRERVMARLLVGATEALPLVHPRFEAGDAGKDVVQVRGRDAVVRELELGPRRHLPREAQAQAQAHETRPQQLPAQHVRYEEFESSAFHLHRRLRCSRSGGCSRHLPYAVKCSCCATQLGRLASS